MKARIVILTMLIFCMNIANIFSSETFTEQELFFVKWGNRRGEIPLYVKGAKAKIFNLSKITYAGPKLFKVDNAGNLYIMLIGYNSQIIKFDQEGTFIASFQYGYDAETFTVDEKENIFVVAQSDEGVKFADFKIFTLFGIFIEESKIQWADSKKDIFYYDNGIYDVSGNSLYKFKKTKHEYTEKKEKSKLLQGKLTMSVGHYDEKLQNCTLTISGLDQIGGKVSKKDLVIEKLKGFAVKDFKLVGVSNDNKIYGVVRTVNADKPGPTIFGILVLDNNGNIITVFHAKRYEIIEPEEYIDNFIDIDLDGNIYQMWTGEDGVFVTKWNKGEKPFFD